MDVAVICEDDRAQGGADFLNLRHEGGADMLDLQGKELSGTHDSDA
jgi:hypothetical protein